MPRVLACSSRDLLHIKVTRADDMQVGACEQAIHHVSVNLFVM